VSTKNNDEEAVRDTLSIAVDVVGVTIYCPPLLIGKRAREGFNRNLGLSRKNYNVTA
jgi:hypothetical protein